MVFKSDGFKAAFAISGFLESVVWEPPFGSWFPAEAAFMVQAVPRIDSRARAKIGRLRVFSCPRDRRSGTRDRCGTKWEKTVAVAIVGACESQDDSDHGQVIDNSELDEYQLFTEQVADKLDLNRSIGGFTIKGDIEVNLVDDEALLGARIYLGTVTVTLG